MKNIGITMIMTKRFEGAMIGFGGLSSQAPQIALM